MAPLDAIEWAYTTHRFRALDHDFAVRTMDGKLGRYLDRVLCSLYVPGFPAQLYSIAELGGSALDRYALSWGEQRIEVAGSPGQVVATLLWHVNREAVEQSGRHLLLHAAAAEWQGKALLLPGPMEAGKTTLVARLVQRGMRYLTDEVAAVHLASGLVVPFPKPLTVDEGSWGALADLEPVTDPADAPYLGPQWHVDPSSIRPNAVAPPAPPGFVVFPRYQAGASTELSPLRRAEALVGLCQSSFNLARHGAAGLHALGAVVAGSDCHRLTVGELEPACELVLGLMGSPRPQPRGVTVP
ncbi:MAG TPA: hypothetical protein VD926_15830 [Acidimicrobiales bacterium]|nr:hypothetical protein [Acidimicrobiales bacterium]